MLSLVKLIAWIAFLPALAAPVALAAQDEVSEPAGGLRFIDDGYTNYGEWRAEVHVNPPQWQPGMILNVTARLDLAEEHLEKLAAAGIKADGFCFLLTAERTFDADGHLRLPGDERMSTLITPTGLAIEGGVTGAVTNRFSYPYRTPVDQWASRGFSEVQRAEGRIRVPFQVQQKLPDDIPPGLYRLRLDFGVVVGGRRFYSLNGEGFAVRPFFKGRPTESHSMSPPIPASGTHVSGRFVDATKIRPRIPWTLLGNYNSNGYRGVVADEDKPHFALSGRSIIPDEVILPLYNANGARVSYSLEPQFPADTIDTCSNIPWDYKRGELNIFVTGPDGKTTHLGAAPFVGANGQWPTTKRTVFTAWRPPAYGRYTVHATGWIADTWGNWYEGGGTYHFWIAKRMTLATATFQGISYPVGGRYGRDLGFAPAVPADVEIEAVLYRNSDPNNKRTMTCKGKATPSGIFTAAQGMTQLILDAPGEYHGKVLAKYVDEEGHLWVSTMRHAGVVYPPDSPVVARGKKLNIKGRYYDRGETQFEGWVDTVNDVNHLAHINFPWQAGDVLLIASDGQGANKIEPVLTYEYKDNPKPYDTRLNGIGATNLRLRTSNGYSPHLFPEYIVDWCYYYAAAPRPGFMGRFIVGEDGVRAPYWPTSPNSFGGQINASSNGDLPGDIYRLIGGVVLRQEGQAPAYAGYIASAFLLPRGTGNNRVIAPGAEDVIGPTGEKARAFLVGTRPGMVYETGASFAPAMQIDPILPVNITFSLHYPDGRRKVASGAGDAFGGFVGPERWTLDVPGIYRYTIDANWQGHRAVMPGLPPGGGEIYVIEKMQPAGAAGLQVNIKDGVTFAPQGAVSIAGTSTASTVRWAAVIPGAVIGQGELQVTGGRFNLTFDPAAINQTTPTYDIVNRVNNRPEIRDVVHLTFFSRETAPDGAPYHCFRRLILRGNQVINAK